MNTALIVLTLVEVAIVVVVLAVYLIAIAGTLRRVSATLGLITRTTRASMLDNLHQDYVRVARAKGLAETSIVNGHVLPNALIPIVTLGGLAYANLLTGAVMTETVFSWPGLGRYTFRSAEALDFPAIMGITLVVAATYLIINLIIDLSYAVLDPRVAR